jgi:hypothetical protein
MTHHLGHRSKQPAHATSQSDPHHAPGRPAKATFPEPDPLLWSQSPHLHVIPAIRKGTCARWRRSAPFAQAARTQPYLCRARARRALPCPALPCRPRPPAPPSGPQQSGLASAAQHWPEALAANEAFSGRGTARVPGAATCVWLQMLPKAHHPS